MIRIKILDNKTKEILKTMCINEKNVQLRSAIKTVIELDDLRLAVKEIQDAIFDHGMLKE